jgi:hypothetical protein
MKIVHFENKKLALALAVELLHQQPDLHEMGAAKFVKLIMRHIEADQY